MDKDKVKSQIENVINIAGKIEGVIKFRIEVLNAALAVLDLYPEAELTEDEMVTNAYNDLTDVIGNLESALDYLNIGKGEGE